MSASINNANQILTTAPLRSYNSQDAQAQINAFTSIYREQSAPANTEIRKTWLDTPATASAHNLVNTSPVKPDSSSEVAPQIKQSWFATPANTSDVSANSLVGTYAKPYAEVAAEVAPEIPAEIPAEITPEIPADANPYANYGDGTCGAHAATCAGPDMAWGDYDAVTTGDLPVSYSDAASPELESLGLENLKTTSEVHDLAKDLKKNGKLTQEISEALRSHVDALISASYSKYDPDKTYMDTEAMFGLTVKEISEQGHDISIYEIPPSVTENLKTPEDVYELLNEMKASGELDEEMARLLLNFVDTLAVDPNPQTEEEGLEILNQLKSSFGGVPSKNDSSIASMIEKFAEKFPEPGDAASALIDVAKAYAELPRAEGLKHFPSQPLEAYFRHATMKMAELAETMDQAGKLTPENVSSIVNAAATVKTMFGAEPDADAMDLQLRKLELMVAKLGGSGMQSVLMR